MRLKPIALLLIALAIICGVALVGCNTDDDSTESNDAPESVTVVDLAGRDVTVPDTVERVVAIGPGALRLLVYADGSDKVVGIEEFESRPPLARPYTLAHPELLELPAVGAGGPDSAPDAERLITVDPDVIFLAQIADSQAADELQASTGIPVVVVSYGSLGTVDEPFFTSLDVVGTALGTTERTDEVATFIRHTLDDLAARMSATADADKPTAFVGALGFKGSHGIESTQAEYLPFEAIGANNVASVVEQPGSVMIDKEKLLEWDPEFIFIDRGGLSLVLEDTRANRATYENLAAVQDGSIYSQLPFNNYWTNVEIALANAYYAGSQMFPDQFADVDPVAKADEISIQLVGDPTYDRLTEIYGGGFDQIDLLESE